ncbi:hypothetical protein PS918_04459 [Pseudomonas fluorescens]|uniref:RHS repeat-associated core domain-containing protein n=1 Tax=Pseudomonas fluorescens TaxID=294 RepID=A0A5E7TZW0_PSEFL|nr:RHS repeat-associated core domain-containing protein [Pseudomonas fluorescens]VVQ04011.1 hypothetical protein PS918_04459 [Pseudomonas fluorescens]
MLEAFIDASLTEGLPMPTSEPANQTSRILLLAGDSKNTVLAEMAGPLHHLAYAPYGQQSSRQEVMTQQGFNGELREAKTDWYVLGKGYRVYNPRLMRFHSPDMFSPFGKGGLNGFAYCGGEPVMRADPSGESWLSTWFFNRFADVMQILSPVGTGGGAGRTAGIAKQARTGGMTGILVGMNKNQATPFLKPSKTTLQKSTPQKGLPTGSTPSPTRSSSAQPGAVSTPNESKSVRTGIILEGNYGVRPQNQFSREKTRDGLRISGTDSGVKQIPSTASGIRSPWPDKH